MIGARPDGTKEMIAVEDGFRESKDSWATLIRDLNRRGMAAPELEIGDGALGFWTALREIMKSDSREAAQEEIRSFREEYGAKYPKVVDTLSGSQDKLLTFFDFPAEYWLHIRTRNPIESAFSTVRLRQRITKGAGSRRRGLTMAFKLLEMAQQRWRRLNGSELLPLVRAGVPFKDGVRVERGDHTARE